MIILVAVSSQITLYYYTLEHVKTLYQFYANNYFKKLSYSDIHDDYITYISNDGIIL